MVYFSSAGPFLDHWPMDKTIEAMALSYLGSDYDVCGESANAVSIKRKIF